MSRPRCRTTVGTHVAVWSRHESRTLTGVVVETRWDNWLHGGAWRVFVAIDGRKRDGQPIVETYFTDHDVDTSVRVERRDDGSVWVCCDTCGRDELCPAHDVAPAPRPPKAIQPVLDLFGALA